MTDDDMFHQYAKFTEDESSGVLIFERGDDVIIPRKDFTELVGKITELEVEIERLKDLLARVDDENGRKSLEIRRLCEASWDAAAKALAGRKEEP